MSELASSVRYVLDTDMMTHQQMGHPIVIAKLQQVDRSTAVTTVVGLIPMVMQWNIDLIHREVSMGAPSSQWWTQLSTAIAGGLTFATVLTLIFTPALLVWRDRNKDRDHEHNASH